MLYVNFSHSQKQEYLRTSFWPLGEFTSLGDAQDQVRRWLDTVANVRKHATTLQRPVDRLQDLRKINPSPFSVTLDYLVDETGVVAEVKDREMLNRIIEIAHLDQDEKQTIASVIDSLLRDAKAKKAYGV